jgi:hypothetical protein
VYQVKGDLYHTMLKACYSSPSNVNPEDLKIYDAESSIVVYVVFSNVCNRSVNSRTFISQKKPRRSQSSSCVVSLVECSLHPLKSVLEPNICISVAPDYQPKMILESMTEPARFRLIQC